MDGILGKTTLAGMFQVFAFGQVNTENIVGAYITVYPLDVGPQVFEDPLQEVCEMAFSASFPREPTPGISHSIYFGMTSRNCLLPWRFGKPRLLMWSLDSTRKDIVGRA